LKNPVDHTFPADMPPKAWYVIFAIFVLAFVDGATSIFLYRPGQQLAPSSFAISVAALGLVFVWYRLDSDSRQFKRTPLLSIAVVGVGIVAMPYYLFRTRGLRRGALATFAFLLMVLGYSAIQYVGQATARALRA
jgi:uncharacterized membrane protein